MKKFFAVIISAALLTAIACADVGLDQVINNLQANQAKIKDMYSETVTTITSNISSAPQKMTQKGAIWTKGELKSKVQVDSPMKQITITNGNKMMILNPETGQKMTQDLTKLNDQMPKGQMSLEKAKEFFTLSMSQKEGKYVIAGTPKKANQFLGKLEFYVDPSRWVPVQILMYDPKGKLMSQSQIDYQQIAGAWVPKNNRSVITTPAGKMEMTMEFKNTKVNSGINDSVFKIE